MKRLAVGMLALLLALATVLPGVAEDVWSCANCGQEGSGNFCSNCGAAKPEVTPLTACPSCQVILDPDNLPNFCSNCGYKLKESEETPVQAAPAARTEAAFPMGTTLRQLRDDTYILTNLIDRETYSKAALTHYFVENVLEGNERGPRDFLVFDLPEGAFAEEFESDYLHCLNTRELLQYSYQLFSSKAYETFMEDVEKENLLADGSDGVAAYYKPDRSQACALFAVPEYSKNAKMYIRITSDRRNITEAEERQLLSDLIMAEYQRVRDTLTVAHLDSYWSAGVYTALELVCPSADISVTYTDPEMILEEVSTAEATLYRAGGSKTQYEIELTDNSYVDYKMQEEPENCTSFSLPDGKTANLYIYWYDEERVTSFRFDIPAGTYVKNKTEKALYAEIEVDLGYDEGMMTQEGVIQMAQEIASRITVQP